VGWRGALRSIAAEARRQERAAARRAREAERAWRESQKRSAEHAAALEADAYEANIEALTSIHRECADSIDWQAVVARQPPSAPMLAAVDRSLSTAARYELEGYAPSFFERLFGLKGRYRGLEQALRDAEQRELASAQHNQAIYASQLAEWNAAVQWTEDMHELAQRILGRDVDAYGEVIRAMECFKELGAVIGDQSISVKLNETQAEITLNVLESHVVPAEQKALTARGKLSVKKLPEARRMEIYQDYVCGAALRVAREFMAVTPIELVLVHVDTSLLNTATGQFEARTILSVACPRDRLARVDWDRVDASDLVSSLLHQMKVKRGKGFAAVDRVSV
jgi:hypothetical protein